MSIIIFKVIYYCKNLRNSAKVAAKWLLIKISKKYLSISRGIIKFIRIYYNTNSRGFGKFFMDFFTS